MIYFQKNATLKWLAMKIYGLSREAATGKMKRVFDRSA